MQKPVYLSIRTVVGILRRRLPASLLAVLVLGSAPHVWACYAVVVGKKASADGSVLVGHNEQNGGRRILNFRRVPRRPLPEGAVVYLLRGGELAQVRETHAFLWSENPGLEFSDGYLNEWGVAVVSDNCPSRENSYEELVGRGEIRDGGIGYMLRRLVVERAKTAREGVTVAAGLIERFGYVDSGRTYVIADPNEAWLLAVVRGRPWIARRVPDDAVVLLANVHIIGEVDLNDKANVMASPDLVDYATKRGWYDPNEGEPFNFRKTYCAKRNDPPDPRQHQGQQLVMETNAAWPPVGSLPFAVTPASRMTVADVISILRDHESDPPICNSDVQEAAVFQLRFHLPREIGCIYWRTSGEPCLSPLTPWYLGITQTPESYYRPTDITVQLSLNHHFDPPAGTFDANAGFAWWKFMALRDAVHEDFENNRREVRFACKVLEGLEYDQQREFEEGVLRLLQSDGAIALSRLTEYCTDCARRAGQEADRLVQELRK